MENFEDYYHDKFIKNIYINSISDFMDEIIIVLENEQGEIITLQFSDCIICKIDGRGWIAGKDSIREWVIKKGDEIKELVPKHIVKNQASEFKYIMINLNISNSSIEIVAKEILLRK